MDANPTGVNFFWKLHNSHQLDLVTYNQFNTRYLNDFNGPLHRGCLQMAALYRPAIEGEKSIAQDALDHFLNCQSDGQFIRWCLSFTGYLLFDLSFLNFWPPFARLQNLWSFSGFWWNSFPKKFLKLIKRPFFLQLYIDLLAADAARLRHHRVQRQE